MLNDIAVQIQQLGMNYPVVKYLAVYVFTASIGILILAGAYYVKSELLEILLWITERLLAIVIMVGLIAWAAACVLFIFPFHCLKNRKVLMDIRRNKKRKV